MCTRHGKKGAFKVFSDGSLNISSLVRMITNVENCNIDMDTSWLEVEVGDFHVTNNLTLSLTDV